MGKGGEAGGITMSPGHKFKGNTMKILIIYDSVYGNTEQIAQAIGKTLGSQNEVEILRVGEVKLPQLTGLDLLIVGSPTQRFRPTTAITQFLGGIPKDGLKGVKIAAFDTRLTISNINETPVLAFFVRLSGSAAYAARPIADRLKKSGGDLIVPPEGFYVKGMEGPLVEGELERAAEWVMKTVK